MFYYYDSHNRLTNVTDWENRKTSFEYDLAGRLTKIVRPNGTLRHMQYDPAGQLTNILEVTALEEPIVWIKQGWDPIRDQSECQTEPGAGLCTLGCDQVLRLWFGGPVTLGSVLEI